MCYIRFNDSFLVSHIHMYAGAVSVAAVAVTLAAAADRQCEIE